MTDFFIYLSYSTLALAALYLLYKVSMSYETLHRLNRVLLLGFVVLSAVLPLCRIEVVEELPAVEPMEFVAPMTDSVVYEVAESFNYTALLQMAFFALFMLGVVVMIARLVISIMSVKRIIRSGEQQSLEGGVTLTIVDKPISPFSWFGHIVVSRADIEQNRDIILTHEMAHIRLHHSWDVLAVDLALCFWWFNPAMWLLRRELQSLHEYQADEEVLNSGIDAQTYQLLLIKRAVGSRLHSVANCLNHSNLNKRITMMCKKTSSRWSAAKALLVLPLVAVSLAATATTVYVPREVQDKVTENSVNDKSEKTQVVKISKSGIYLNGEKITLEELKAKVAEWDTVTIEADKNVKMGDVAELKEALRENGTLKVNYLVAEDEPKQNKKASAEEAPVAEEKERVATVSEQPKDVANANVHGRVIDAKTKKQVPNVAVLIKEKSIGVFADESGQYIIKGQPEGIYTLIASAVGYKSAEKSVSIAPDKNVEVNFELEENVVSLNEVTVNSDTKVAEANAKAAAAKVQEAANAQAAAEAKVAEDGDMPYVKVEKMPTFMGGDLNVFRNWVQSKIQYPKEAMDKGIKGRVVCSFVVEKDGSLTDFDVLQSPDKSLADEVVRILKTSPKWEPGEQRGEKVRVKYTVPIVFSIGNNNVTDASTTKAQAAAEAKVAEDGDMPYVKVEKMPTFMGGDLNVFRNWVQSKIQYPKEAMDKGIKGRVVCSFVVEKDGSLTDFDVLQSPDKSLADEVVRILKTSPKWEPGEQRGEKVRVKYTVPIVFSIAN